MAAATLGTGLLLLSAQLVGLAGAFRLFPVLLACAALAVAGGLLAQRGPALASAPADAPGPRDAEPAWVTPLAAAAVGAGAVQWATALVPTVRGGILDLDGLHYHLTHAAQYVQSGRLLPLRFVDTAHPSAYYPSNDETLRAVGLLAAHTDLAGLLVNVGVGALVLLAAVLLGRRWGRSGTTVLATVVLLAGPLYGPRYAGWAHVDWTAVAFLGVAVAVLATRPGHGGATIVAGTALGIAAGTKLTAAPAVALVAAAAIIHAARGTRWATTVRIVVPALAVGGWWYVRNLLVVGTPMPGLPLFGGPQPLVGEPAPAVADYLTDVDVLRSHYLPGLRLFFGWGWPLLAVLLLAGLVVAVRAGGWPRALAVGAALAGAAYLVTPTTALGPPGEPVLFTSNLRYAWPALLLAGWATSVAWRHAVVPAALAVVIAIGLVEPRAWVGVGGVAAVVGAVLALAAAMLARRPPSRRLLVRWGALVAVVGLLVLFLPVRGIYQARRYRTPEATDQHALTELFAAAQDVTHRTVAVSGLPLTYPFLGADRTNTLHVPAAVLDDGARVPHDTCAAYRGDLARAGVTVAAVVVGPSVPSPPELGWLLTDPSARVLARNARGVVVALDAAPDPEAC